MRPAVSVIITTYNQAEYIGAAIESAIAQDFEDREIIVVDDGSTDETPERVAAFQREIVYLRQANQGVAASRNAGIRRARGEFLAFLDGDDLWEAPKLSRQVQTAREHPESGLIVTDGVQFDDQGRILRQSMFAPSIRALLGPSDAVTIRCYDLLLRQNVILSSSQVLVSRAVLDDVGLSDLRIPHASDWDLYVRIAKRYEITFLREALTRWRYLATSVSGPEHLRELRWAADEIAVVRKQLKQSEAGRRPEIQAWLDRRAFELVYKLYCHGIETDRAFSRRHLLRILRRYPTSRMAWTFLVALHLPRRLNRGLGRIARGLRRERGR